MAMRTTIIGVILLSLGLLVGCNSGNSNKSTSDKPFIFNYAPADSLAKKHLEALVLDSADRHCVDKVNEFAFSLLHQIAIDKDSSFVVAPLSLASAIAMAGNGAVGEVRDSLEQVFGPIINANAFYKKYMAALPHSGYTNCLILNYLATNTDAPILDAFSKTVSASYNACVKNHDFASKKAVNQINDWFHEQSLDDKIKVIEKLDPETSLGDADMVCRRGHRCHHPLHLVPGTHARAAEYRRRYVRHDHERTLGICHHRTVGAFGRGVGIPRSYFAVTVELVQQSLDSHCHLGTALCRRPHEPGPTTACLRDRSFVRMAVLPY